MSKEQTPKDFESYLEQMGYSWNDFDYTSAVEGLVEQYAQAKVLEALEMEVVQARMTAPIDKVIRERWDYSTSDEALNYYETEVKPKYETQCY